MHSCRRGTLRSVDVGIGTLLGLSFKVRARVRVKS